MTPHTLFADDQICKQCHVLFLQINLRQDLLLKKTNKNFSSCLILLIQQDTTLGNEDRAERMLSMCRVPRVRYVCLQQSLHHLPVSLCGEEDCVFLPCSAWAADGTPHVGAHSLSAIVASRSFLSSFISHLGYSARTTKCHIRYRC